MCIIVSLIKIGVWAKIIHLSGGDFFILFLDVRPALLSGVGSLEINKETT